jgi:hypothetical protein
LNHSLYLLLELLEQAASGFRFRVTARNDSATKLFLPRLEVISLRFSQTPTGSVAEWYTRSLVSAAGGGFTLEPAESHSFEWHVRPCSFEPPPQAEGDYSDWEYRRWCVGIGPGEYVVRCQWQVDEGFFDPDSHMRLLDLQYAAVREGAVVWLGQAESNPVQVVYAEPVYGPEREVDVPHSQEDRSTL